MSSTKTRKIFGKVVAVTGNEKRRKHLRALELPKSCFVRLNQIIGDPKADPPIPALIAIGKSSWWRGITEGKYPKGIKLGPRTTVWSLEAVLASIQGMHCS